MHGQAVLFPNFRQVPVHGATFAHIVFRMNFKKKYGEKITYTVFCFDEDEVIEKKHSAPISLDAGKITIDQEFTAIGNSPKLPPDCEVPFKKGAVLKYKFVGACLELTREDDTRFVRVPMTDRLTGVGGSVANNN